MLGGILGIFTPKVSLVAVLLLVALLAGKQTQLYFVRSDLEDTKTKLAVSSANLAVSEANTLKLTTQIELQNESIRALESKGKISEASAKAKALAAIERGRKEKLEAARHAGFGAEAMNAWIASLQ